MRIVDTGSGYNSQNVLPVHVAVPDDVRFDIEVIVARRGERRSTRVRADEIARAGRLLTVRAR
jgi:hypothetical protein